MCVFLGPRSHPNSKISVDSDDSDQTSQRSSFMVFLSCADPGNFVRGVQVSLTKKALITFFFSPQLIFTEVKWSIISKISIIFQGFRGGPTFSRGGGVQHFPRGGGGVQPFPVAYSL